MYPTWTTQCYFEGKMTDVAGSCSQTSKLKAMLNSESNTIHACPKPALHGIFHPTLCRRELGDNHWHLGAIIGIQSNTFLVQYQLHRPTKSDLVGNKWAAKRGRVEPCTSGTIEKYSNMMMQPSSKVIGQVTVRNPQTPSATAGFKFPRVPPPVLSAATVGRTWD